MRRTLTFARYLPAVLCGLLVVAWVASVPVSFGFLWGHTHAGCDFGGLVIHYDSTITHVPTRLAAIYRSSVEIGANYWVGDILCASNSSHDIDLVLPIPLLLTLLFPLASGPFVRFRFPLWSWFAWTALIALELAVYLR